jgi:hypothetical protein
MLARSQNEKKLVIIKIWNQLHTLIVYVWECLLLPNKKIAFDHNNLESVAHPYCLPVHGDARLGTRRKKLVIITNWSQLHTLIVCLCVGTLAIAQKEKKCF